MVTRTALRLNLQQHGLRPLNPVRDLGGVADLLEKVFSRELDANGRQMIREARMLSRTGPLLYLLSLLSGGIMGLSPGFVWDEDGQIIGNITMMRSSKRPRAWQVANVAVHPDYRHQGIATRMVEAAVDYVCRQNGHSIDLQVRQDNPAVALYLQLGFQSLGAVTRWELSGRMRKAQILTHGRTVVRAQRQDWAAIWQLFRSVMPAAQGWPDPWSESDFQPSYRRWLADLAGIRTVKRWVAPRAAGPGLDGYIEFRASPGMVPQLTLRVRPELSAELEGDLLLVALRHMSRKGHYRAISDHPAGDVPAEGRLREAGFRPLRTLLVMRLGLNRRKGG